MDNPENAEKFSLSLMGIVTFCFFVIMCKCPWELVSHIVAAFIIISFVLLILAVTFALVVRRVEFLRTSKYVLIVEFGLFVVTGISMIITNSLHISNSLTWLVAATTFGVLSLFLYYILYVMDPDDAESRSIRNFDTSYSTIDTPSRNSTAPY